MNKCIATLCIALGICFGSCQDDMDVNNGTVQRNPDKGLPVTFTTELLPMAIAGEASSRADIEDLYKNEFVEGDYLHVSATFTLLSENSQPGETTTQYELLKYKAGEWQSTDATLLTWPWNAEKATFTAYFIGASDGLLQPNDPKEIALDTLSWNTDPLEAKTGEIAYGHAVPLTFKHLCTKLSITDVSGRGSEYWAKKENIPNQFYLTRDENNTLTPSFHSVGDNSHISAQRTEDNTVSYYLAPGDYAGMSLTYRYDRPYLTLNITELDGLEAGESHVVSVIRNSGDITIDEDEDNEWEEPGGEDVTEVQLGTADINAFLTAIQDGTEYSYSGTPVLARSEEIEGGTELLVNVDFNNNPFNAHDLPITVFNGNYHYIRNIIRPLFEQINGGRIMNLGLHDVNIEEQYATAVGAIARESTTADATQQAIHNVRLHNINIEVTPTTNYDQTCDVGVLVGNSNSQMNAIRLGGNISVTVQTVDTERRLGTINIGGIIGQLYTSGQLSDVSQLEEEIPGTITVTSSCPNRYGDRNTGGLVGLSNGHIENCILNNATVDASNTRGVMVYTGGLAGMARGVVNSHNTDTNGIFNSTFGGIIKCGRAYSTSTEDESAEGHAYAGGAVGYAYWSDHIQDNEIFGTLVGPIGDDGQDFTPWSNSIYATGGLFGQAYQAPTSGNTTWITFEDQLTNDVENYHIGTIAGRADANSTPENNENHTPGSWDEIGDIITSEDLPGEETGN